MTTKTFFIELLAYCTVIPSAFMCYLPMKNQLKHTKKQTLLAGGVIIALTITVLAGISCFVNIQYVVVIPAIFIYYVLYHNSLKVPVYKSLAIFLYVLAYLGIIFNLSHILTAYSYENMDPDMLKLKYSLFQTGFSIIFMLLTWIPFSRFGPKLIDGPELKKTWYVTIPITSIILILCIRIAPRKYETLYVNFVYVVYWYLILGLLFFLVFFSIIFYYILKELKHYMEVENKNKILEVQESLFLRTQKYLEETARTRHDFKHFLVTLKKLSEEGNTNAVKEYLDKYIESTPQKDIVTYCNNHPLNAVLNHYASVAAEENIKTIFQIDLPDILEISDLDICSIAGNILDNAITASKKIEPGVRNIRLLITRNHNSHIYIISENRFNGKCRKKNDKYLSTTRSGSGIGLSSIQSIAERYGGTARFYNDEKTFYSEVVI